VIGGAGEARAGHQAQERGQELHQGGAHEENA
jgi:hypothetical protein